MGEQESPSTASGPEEGSERYKRLPAPIKLEDTVESQETEPARDPDGGRNPDRDFMIRYSGGG